MLGHFVLSVEGKIVYGNNKFSSQAILFNPSDYLLYEKKNVNVFVLMLPLAYRWQHIQMFRIKLGLKIRTTYNVFYQF